MDSLGLQGNLGEGSRTPRWGIAFKFPARPEETTLLDIKVQVGRTGVLTPVAVLSPVVLGGVVVERATLHNQDEVNRLQLRPGMRVRIVRSGDVIPKVLGAVTPPEPLEASTDLFSLPSQCPCCGSPTEQEILLEGNSTDRSVVVRCTGGLACSAQTIEGIKHFCSRAAVDIKVNYFGFTYVISMS